MERSWMPSTTSSRILLMAQSRSTKSWWQVPYSLVAVTVKRRAAEGAFGEIAKTLSKLFEVVVCTENLLWGGVGRVKALAGLQLRERVRSETGPNGASQGTMNCVGG